MGNRQDASGRYGDDRRRGGGGDDGGGPISNTLEATKEKLGWTKEKAEEEARYLADKAKETAGYMKEQGKQKAETATKASKHLLKPGQDPRDACEDFHRLLQNCLMRSDCDLKRCRIEMEALHNCCKHGFENTSRYCYWKVGMRATAQNTGDDNDDDDRRGERRGRGGLFF